MIQALRKLTGKKKGRKGGVITKKKKNKTIFDR